jgi:uncharacterized protein YbjT (DUF2867 family)
LPSKAGLPTLGFVHTSDSPIPGPVAVIGGSGCTGRLVVDALHREDARVRVVSRDPARAAKVLGTAVRIYRGDVRDSLTLDGPLRDASAVVLAVTPGLAASGPDRPEATMYEGVRNVLRVCLSWLCDTRIVLISQADVIRQPFPANHFGRLLEWRLRGEALLRSHGLPYTIIRPGTLTEPAGPARAVRFEQGDITEGTLSRGDLAEACVQALICPEADRTTFEIFNEDGEPGSDWDKKFASLRKDQ